MSRAPRSVLVAGIGRLLSYAGIAAALAVGLALAIALWRDSDLWRAAALGLYLGGGLLVAVPVLFGARSPMTVAEVGYEKFDLGPEARKAWYAQSAAYLMIGLVLIGAGVLIEVAGLPSP